MAIEWRAECCRFKEGEVANEDAASPLLSIGTACGSAEAIGKLAILIQFDRSIL